MKQHIEIITKVKTIKEIQTRTGKFMYNFSIPITKMSGEEQLTEWMQVTILQEEQRPDLQGAKEVHFIGQLTVKESYKDYPQSVSIFGFYIEPVLSQVYRQRKVKKNTTPEPTQAPKQVQDIPQQASDGQRGQQGSQFPDMEQEETIPFMYISKRLSHAI